MIKFAHTIVLVKDIEVSKRFYRDLLGQEIEKDCGAFVLFKSLFALHEAKPLCRTIYGTNEFDAAAGTEQGSRNLLIYFETKDPDACCQRLAEAGVEIIHGVKKQEWGQRVFRFYDPDRHMVEIGEAMDLRFD
ncbi:VOC family protein [Acetanaerobacterium elongatum]|uniref:Glyoxalase-like domain-containing protein n=1 Tax=Acetanaerobacterium elongatum TaxID=258515 RepID=A0A1H0GLW2_9FIRM|nr:VOC family protein [Acetanaerobacterium elongatum]SDO07874.1 Glyoxalase-like domain-containing protein [Acetanaerobacterium elongatum]